MAIARRRLALVAAVAIASSGGACSVASLSYGELATELDGIVRVERTGRAGRLAYAPEAPTSAWYMLFVPLRPISGVLGFLFGARHATQLENPAGYARDLLAELPDEAGADLSRCTDTVLRLGYVAELDTNRASRVGALDGLAVIAANLQLGLFQSPELVGVVAEPERVAQARGQIELLSPERRSAPLDDAARQQWAAALESLTEHPLPQWFEQLALVDMLRAAWHAEPEAAAGVEVERALRRALRHFVEGALLRALQASAPDRVEVRLVAIDLVRRFGGPRIVPLLLAVVVPPPSRAVERLDPLVQLRLIHLCGQLHGELAYATLRLPGREAWEALAPADFLAQVVLNERAYYSLLRVPAIAALSLCLQRPRLDFDESWVEEWVRERQRQL
jgi:hypothetical protein